jgi:hypothetical protein
LINQEAAADLCFKTHAGVNGLETMQSEFSNLSPEERVVRCLEHARSSLDRANGSEDVSRKEIHANLAGCWHSAARQFETLSLLLKDVTERQAAQAASRAAECSAEVPAAEAAGFLIAPNALPVAA